MKKKYIVEEIQHWLITFEVEAESRRDAYNFRTIDSVSILDEKCYFNEIESVKEKEEV